MLLTVGDFRVQASDEAGLSALVDDLRLLTGRGGAMEAQAWRDSLPVLAEAIDEPYFDQMHLFFGGMGNIAVEYRLPSSPKWCDIVLVGRNASGPAAVIVELKHWITRGDKSGRYTGLMSRHLGEVNHPSDQVKGYVEYCKAFHSAVQDHSAALHGCVFFSTSADLKNYRLAPNDQLATEFPLFSARPGELKQFPAFLKTRLHQSDKQFAEAFKLGRYRQSRSLCLQVSAQIADEKSSPFVLLDEQRTAFSVSMAEVRDAMNSGKKRVVIVQGPPGSGKSVVAARLWAKLVQDYGRDDRAVCMVTTSASQNSNWRSMFMTASGQAAADGFILKANAFIPFTTQQQAHARTRQGATWRDATEWQTNLKIAQACGLGQDRVHDDEIGVSIVDEAHALINPEHSDGRGQFGFPVIAGPQAYHIIRGSKVSIFLLDSAQSFRDRETTSVADIERFASMLNAELTHVDLSDAQFRCGGSVEYTKWVDGLLAGNSSETLQDLAAIWIMEKGAELPRAAEPRSRVRHRAPNSGFEFRLFNDPAALEIALRKRLNEGFSARLLSSYSVPWKTQRITNPHVLPAEDKDFHIPLPEGAYAKHWSKVWNVTPSGQDYAPFVQGVPGSGVHDDPLSEVGCPYVVRGFDFDYIGLIWLNDFVWVPAERRWVVNLDQVHESGLSRLRFAAQHNAVSRERLTGKIAQAYRILLTRPVRGAYLWINDGATRQRVEESLQ